MEFIAAKEHSFTGTKYFVSVTGCSHVWPRGSQSWITGRFYILLNECSALGKSSYPLNLQIVASSICFLTLLSLLR